MELIKVIDDKEKLVISAKTEDACFIDELKKDGFIEGESSEAWDGRLYVKGYAPEKPQEIKEKQIRFVRNQYLADTDKFMIADFPITEKERTQYRDYRQYLRDYTKTEGWFEKEPETFEEWGGK